MIWIIIGGIIGFRHGLKLDIIGALLLGTAGLLMGSLISISINAFIPAFINDKCDLLESHKFELAKFDSATPYFLYTKKTDNYTHYEYYIKIDNDKLKKETISNEAKNVNVSIVHDGDENNSHKTVKVFRNQNYKSYWWLCLSPADGTKITEISFHIPPNSISYEN